MRQGVIAVMLMCVSGVDGAGPLLPTNVPPVRLFDELDCELPGLAQV